MTNNHLKHSLAVLIMTIAIIFISNSIITVTADEGWLWPVPDLRRISSPMMAGRIKKSGAKGEDHRGIDIDGNNYTVVATRGGWVEEVDKSKYLGCYVVLRHEVNGQTLYSLYAHLADGSLGSAIVQTKNRDKPINQGDFIGKTGKTGEGVTGPHLHFAVSKKRLSDYINVNPDAHSIENGGLRAPRKTKS